MLPKLRYNNEKTFYQFTRKPTAVSAEECCIKTESHLPSNCAGFIFRVYQSKTVEEC